MHSGARRAALRARRRPDATARGRGPGGSSGGAGARRATASTATPTRTRSTGSGRRSSARTPATCSLRPALGYEFVDWGGADHLGGGSHGSLHRDDSQGVLLLCGVDPPGAGRVVDRRRHRRWCSSTSVYRCPVSEELDLVVRHGPHRFTSGCVPACASRRTGAQLDQVLHRRRVGLCRQPVRLRALRRGVRHPPHRRRDARLRGRGEQQLLVEPALDVRAPAPATPGFQASRFFAVSVVRVPVRARRSSSCW